MKTYNQNGTISEKRCIISNENKFSVQIERFGSRDYIFYPGDELSHEIDCELVNLYDKFRDLYFTDTELYYREIPVLPTVLVFGGQNSDILISKEEFLIKKNEFSSEQKNLNRHIYLSDCQYLVSSVQNILSSVEYCFVQYFAKIASINAPEYLLREDRTFSCVSEECGFLIETFFTKLYSVMDLMVKIIWELENPVENLESIIKLKSSEKLWGDRKNLKINKRVNTIFEDCEIIRQIESIRNEVVHNGSWEFRPKVYMCVENKKIVERYMLFPDFEDGRLATVKSRRRFFHDQTKVNDVIISIHDDFYRRLLATLKFINQSVEAKYKTDSSLE